MWLSLFLVLSIWSQLFLGSIIAVPYVLGVTYLIFLGTIQVYVLCPHVIINIAHFTL